MLGEWVNNLVESFFYIFFLNQFHGNRKGEFWKQWGTLTAVFLLFLNITLADSITFFHWSTTIVDCFVVFPYAFLYLYGSWYSWMISVVLFNLGMVGSVILSMGISSLIMPAGIGTWMTIGETERVVLLVVSKLFLLGYMYVTIKGKRLFCKFDSRRIYGAIVLIPLLVIAMACLILELLLQVYRMEGNTEIFVLLLTGIMMLLIVIIYLYIHAIKKHEKQRENKILLEMITAQRDSIKKELDSYEKLRKVQHDMKNYLLGIKYYVDKGELETGAAYLNEILCRLSECGNRVSTVENAETLWGAMIDMKLTQAQGMGIMTEQHVYPGRYEVIHSLDLCVILGNLLDNAIEAEAKNDDRKEIMVEMKEIHRFIYIKISNWVDDNRKEEAGKLLSQKEDPMLHGLGIRNVLETVKKYEGKFETEIAGNYFHAKVMLQMKEKMTFLAKS